MLCENTTNKYSSICVNITGILRIHPIIHTDYWYLFYNRFIGGYIYNLIRRPCAHWYERTTSLAVIVYLPSLSGKYGMPRGINSRRKVCM